jgi:DNA-binding response OmpR family regulator
VVNSTIRGNETILFADDEPLIRKLAQTALSNHGYHVLSAEDGQEAVEIYQREQTNIDLVILDLMMPRLSGQDACHQIRQLDPGARILFVSGFADNSFSEVEQSSSLGLVAKPYRPDELAKTVRSVLDRNRP